MFLKKRFYIAVFLVVVCFIFGHWSVFMFTSAQVLFFVLVGLFCYEAVLLFFLKKKGVACRRECSDRFSNGDNNEVKLHLSNAYPFAITVEIIDEVPVQFQMRDLFFHLQMKKQEDKILKYSIRPTKRGIYGFGLVNVFVSTKIGFINRRFKTGMPVQVKVYPSFLFLKQLELTASTNKLTQHGKKKIKKIGQQLEPDQIKDYVKGDDYRFINWKATARKHKLMTNVFREERAQNVYCLIDKGRTMQSAFEGMTLLDYSINAALALSYVTMLKEDKTGLLTFEKKQDSFVPASRRKTQLYNIQETLYAQTTTFEESDFGVLYQSVSVNIKSRSLLVIFTNFDSVRAMQRQLKYLSILSKRHSVLVIFFENTEIEEFAEKVPVSKTDAYETVIAEKMEYEKLLIIHTLRQNNILSLLTHPNSLTINVINKYLEIKAREM